MKSAVRTAVVLFVAAAGCAAFRVIGDAVTFPWSDDWTEPLLKLVFWVAPCAVMLRIWGVPDYRAVARELGLTGMPARGYGFGLAASVPIVLAVPFGRDLHG